MGVGPNRSGWSQDQSRALVAPQIGLGLRAEAPAREGPARRPALADYGWASAVTYARGEDRRNLGAGMRATRASSGWHWRDLSLPHRRWLLYNAVLMTAIINVIANAGIAWLSVRGRHSVPLWRAPGFGRTSTITDTVGTFFFLPLFTCLSCTTAVWQQVRSGRLAPLSIASSNPPFVNRLPPGRWRRSLLLGAVCTAVLTPVAIPVLFGANFGGVSTETFVWYKAALGVGLGLIVTPVIALRAMTDAA
jgi:hypothetical protein